MTITTAVTTPKEDI